MGAELLAPVYGPQAKAESTNCFKIYSKCFRFQNMRTSIDIKFLSLFSCSSACKEMFCLVDILKIGVITYRMVFWWSFDLETGADLGGGCRGCAPSPEITCGFLTQLVFCKKKNCGLLVLKKSKRRAHPLLKKSWIRPWETTVIKGFNSSLERILQNT